MPQPVIGCDLSRAFLDLRDLPSGRMQRIPNTCDAIVEWAETLTPEKPVVFEATSGCDDLLIAILTKRAHIPSRASIRVRLVSSPARPAFWPRPTASMRAC